MEKETILIIPIPKSASAALEHTLRKLHKFDSRKLVKKHVYPTEENVDSLRGQKKIILLRNPQECLEASQRAVKTKITPLALEKENGFLNYDYKGFYNGWINNIDDKSLLIFYKDLVNNPKETINKIERFFDLKRSKRVKLVKVNYSRSKFGNLKRKVFIELRKIEVLKTFRNRYFPRELRRMTMVNK